MQKDRPRRFLEIFAAILKHSNYRFLLDIYSRIATKCGRCSCMCQVYEETGDPEDVPCYRSELLLRVYRRHFTLGGMLYGKIFGNRYLADKDIDEMAEAFYRCTACRRCSIECPMGIDHGLITRLGRYILSEMGIAPKALVVSTREQLEGATRNTSAIPVKALLDSCEFLEEEILEAKGVPVKFPINVEGAEYIFFPPVSDYLMEAETLMGNAVVLHAAGISWTIGTGYTDAINYGLFYNDRLLANIARKEVEELHRLQAKKILIGECGHASRAAKYFIPTFCGGKQAPEVVNCMELTLRLLEQGRLKLNPKAITETVTYHDPCNIARTGWIIEQPRTIIKSFIKNFVEMSPNKISNYCCGGGGGTVSVDEIRRFRTEVAGKRKAEQLRATGADIVIAPCANCKKQLRELIQDYGLEMEVKGLHDLIFTAIEF
ncbi:MAG: (Fe-S)-binding protein [Deltaproteobacteria bacterium]|nr:(Fe-S)-binding protein [Deltaproteobacteria bacterium]MBW2308769.1 (Fe-S)-binding protein [Deltaproteobacteria bacterium]